jgi:hypothetical protein
MDTQTNATQDRIINRALYIGRRMVRAARHGDMAMMVTLDEKVGDLMADAVAFDHHLADTRPPETNTRLPETEVLVAKLLTHYKRKSEEAAEALRAEQDRMPVSRTVTMSVREWGALSTALVHKLGSTLSSPNMANEHDRAVVMLAQSLGIIPSPKAKGD